jgi:hypothetical protein
MKAAGISGTELGKFTLFAIQNSLMTYTAPFGML